MSFSLRIACFRSLFVEHTRFLLVFLYVHAGFIKYAQFHRRFRAAVFPRPAVIRRAEGGIFLHADTGDAAESHPVFRDARSFIGSAFHESRAPDFVRFFIFIQQRKPQFIFGLPESGRRGLFKKRPAFFQVRFRLSGKAAPKDARRGEKSRRTVFTALRRKKRFPKSFRGNGAFRKKERGKRRHRLSPALPFLNRAAPSAGFSLSSPIP